MGAASNNTLTLADAQARLRYALTRVKAAFGALPLQIVINVMENLTSAVMFGVNAWDRLTAPIRENETAMKILGGTINFVSDALTPLVAGIALVKGAAVAKKGTITLLNVVLGKNAVASLKAAAANKKLAASKGKVGIASKGMGLKSAVGQIGSLIPAAGKAVKSMGVKGLAGKGLGLVAKGAVALTGPLGWAALAVAGVGIAAFNALRPCQELAAEYERLQERVDILKAGHKDLKNVIEQSADEFAVTKMSVQELKDAYNDQKISIETLGMAYDAFSARQTELQSQYDRTRATMARVTREREELYRKMNDEAYAVEDLQDLIDGLDAEYVELQGTLEEVSGKLAENEVALDSKRDALLDAKIASGDYAAAVAMMGEEVAGVIDYLVGVHDRLRDSIINGFEKIESSTWRWSYTTNEAGEQVKTYYANVAQAATKSLQKMNDALENNIRVYRDFAENMNTISEAFGQDTLNTWYEMAQGCKSTIDMLATNTLIMGMDLSNGFTDEMARMGATCLTTFKEMQIDSTSEIERLKGNVEDLSAVTSEVAQARYGEMAEGAIEIAGKMADDVTTKFDNLSEEAIASIEKLNGRVTSETSEMAADVTSTTSDMTSTVSTDYSTLSTDVTSTVSDMCTAIVSQYNSLKADVTSTTSDMASTVSTEHSSMKSDVTSTTSGMAEESTSIWSRMRDQVGTTLGLIRSQASTDTSGMSTEVVSNTDAMSTGVSNSTSQMSTNVSNDMSQLTSTVESGITQTVSTINREFTSMTTNATTQMNQLPTAATRAMNNLNSQFRAGMNSANSTVRSGNSTLNSTMNQLSGSFQSAGASAMAGLNRGLNNGRGGVMATARGIANQVAATINQALQVNSPSRVLMETGKNVALGLSYGIKKYSNEVQKEMLSLSKLITGTVDGPGASLNANTTNISSINQDINVNRDEELQLLRQQNELLTSLLNKDSDIYMDDRVVGEVLADPVKQSQNRNSTRQRTFRRVMA